MQVTGRLPKRCQTENECQGACDTEATSPGYLGGGGSPFPLPLPSPSPVAFPLPPLPPHSTTASRHTSQSQDVNMPPPPSCHLMPKSPDPQPRLNAPATTPRALLIHLKYPPVSSQPRRTPPAPHVATRSMQTSVEFPLLDPRTLTPPPRGSRPTPPLGPRPTP